MSAARAMRTRILCRISPVDHSNDHAIVRDRRHGPCHFVLRSERRTYMRFGAKTLLGVALAALLGAAVASERAQAADPSLTATFMDKTKDPADRTAAVAVEVSGVNLVDPATTDGKPKADQAHLHYQL